MSPWMNYIGAPLMRREAIDHVRLAVAQVARNHGALAGARDLDRDIAADEACAASQQNGRAHQTRSVAGWQESLAHSK
jgi:hypothetical protein